MDQLTLIIISPIAFHMIVGTMKLIAINTSTQMVMFSSMSQHKFQPEQNRTEQNPYKQLRDLRHKTILALLNVAVLCPKIHLQET